MGLINTSDLKSGMRVIFNSEPWQCVNVDFVKPGKGAAFYKIRVTNLITGNTLDKTLRSGEKVEEADVVESPMEYLYFDGSNYVFMNTKDYEQLPVPADAVQSNKDFLLENMECSVTLWNGEAINIRLPNTVKMKVAYTEDAVKGDTSNRVMKDATLETDAVVSVPTFIAIGEEITIDTRTREYVGRT